MSPEKFEDLKASLELLDNKSKGPWAYNLLTLIQKNPKIDLTDLADLTGNGEGLKIKTNELNSLGLIFSHNVGHSLSPLGKEFLAKLHS